MELLLITSILWNCCLLRFCGTVVCYSGSVDLLFIIQGICGTVVDYDYLNSVELLFTQVLWNCCLLFKFCGTVVDYLHSVELVFTTQVLWNCCLLLKGSVELLFITCILWNCCLLFRFRCTLGNKLRFCEM